MIGRDATARRKTADAFPALSIPVDKRRAGRYGDGGFRENEGEWRKAS